MSSVDAPAPVAEENLVHIGDVAQKTGINPVTLRAWERRYGLIQPHRSAKGQRLYSNQNIEQIHLILDWLERGLSISQVKPLLSQRPEKLTVLSHWEKLQQRWQQCIDQLDGAELEQLLEWGLSQHSAQCLYQQLLLPVLNQQQQRWHHAGGARLEQVFFLTWLRTQLSLRVTQRNAGDNTAPLLVLNLAQYSMHPEAWLCAWLASEAGSRLCVFDGPIPAAEFKRIHTLLKPKAVLLVCGQKLDMAYLQRLQADLACPALLCGQAIHIHAKQLISLPELELVDSPLSALFRLQRLGLLSPSGAPQCIS